MQHRNLPRRSVLAAAAGLSAGIAGVAGIAAPAQAAQPARGTARVYSTEPAPVGPDEALARLLAGNRRFTSGHSVHPHQSLRRLHEVAAGQHPFVATLGCADSRVAPELLFDQGIGDVFDNRIAGNVVDELLLGSAEYPVEEFGTPLVMVLGHERCGAITATVNAVKTGATFPGHIGALVAALRPVVETVIDQPGDPVENGVRANVRAQVHNLIERSEIIRERVEAGTVKVVGARYDLDTGVVTLVC